MLFNKKFVITPKTETNNEKNTVDLGKGTLEFRKILYLSKPSDTKPTMSFPEVCTCCSVIGPGSAVHRTVYTGTVLCTVYVQGVCTYYYDVLLTVYTGCPLEVLSSLPGHYSL